MVEKKLENSEKREVRQKREEQSIKVIAREDQKGDR